MNQIIFLPLLFFFSPFAMQAFRCADVDGISVLL